MTVASDARPQWLKDDGRQAGQVPQRYPVPPIPVGLKVERRLDEGKAAVLERDYLTAIREADARDGLDWLRVQILDAMTANRLGSAQAARLVAEVLRRIEGGGHTARRITAAGEDVALMPAGQAEGGE